jgi:hypothetical protein
MSTATDARVLVLAPTGREAEMTCEALRAAGVGAQSCPTMTALCAAIGEGAAAVLIAEEAFQSDAFEQLVRLLEAQEPWADLPVVVLAGGAFSESTGRATRVLDPLRNVMVLERPIRVAVLVTAMRVALRSRQRQYELRGYLEMRDRHARERAVMLVSERQARHEAEAANRLKDEFLATVSHELRTPVNVILGWSGMLRRDGMTEAQRLHALDVIYRNAHAQARVIDELLDVSRIIAGKLRLEITNVGVVALLQEVIDSVRPAFEAKALTIETCWADGVPALSADADRLRQVFWNLLINAAKFTPDGGRVRIAVEHDQGHVGIRVSDTGIGITADILPFVFDRFRQADSTTTRAHGGLGLGLAIVRQLVELHGGTVEASSAGAGQGAEFAVRLPTRRRAAETAASTGGAPDLSEHRPRLDGTRLLVVDDERDGRELVVTLLRSQGASVQCASDADEAVRIVRDFRPEVMLIDIAMPGVDGYRLLARLREAQGQRSVPAIAFTAYARAEDRQKTRAAGFAAHVAKPFDELLLLMTIHDLSLTPT